MAVWKRIVVVWWVMAVCRRVVVWLMVRVTRRVVVCRIVTVVSTVVGVPLTVVMSIRGGKQEGVKVLMVVEASVVVGMKRIIGVPLMELVT